MKASCSMNGSIEIGWRRDRITVLLLILLFSVQSSAAVFGNVRGVVHDPQHHPLSGALATLKAKTSEFRRTTQTDDNGAFEFSSVPVGEYEVTVSAAGFAEQKQSVFVSSSNAYVLHYPLVISGVREQIEVSAEPATVNPESSTSQTVLSRREIAGTPGADRINSLAFITDFVPGAYMVHDQLHLRGGHQVTWALDGIPLPNTNIASNVGAQFDPKDMDYVEVQRGGSSAEYGDRTYGVINVTPRTGFERNREGEVVISFGNRNSTDNQLSFGSHSEKFAWYASLNGNRSDYGLETPVPRVLHDQVSGGGGFTSLIYNPNINDQLRFVAGVRADYFQVPNDLEAQAANIRNREREQDAFTTFSWVHVAGPGKVFTVSPFFHFNRAAFEGGRFDVPAATDNRASLYLGGQASMSLVKGGHNARFGLYSFAQHDQHFFSLAANDGTGSLLKQRVTPSGDLEALFLDDRYKAASWLTFNAGIRLTHFSGGLAETAVNPRVGVALEIPRLRWVVRAVYGRYYQAPPLETLSGPLIKLAVSQGFGFLPLHGERDEQHEFGLTIPLGGWAFDVASFRTGARNFFDHNVLGASNIFFPVTINHARIAGTEVTVQSPRLFHRANLHLAYSYQSAEGQGGISGGLTDFTPPVAGSFFLDHDQRNTLSAGFRTDLAWGAFLGFNFTYGSGFLNGNGPAHLPSHRSFDFSIGKSFGEDWKATFNAVNIADQRYLLDLSNTFGGSHYVDPRLVSLQLRYRFHF